MEIIGLRNSSARNIKLKGDNKKLPKSLFLVYLVSTLKILKSKPDVIILCDNYLSFMIKLSKSISSKSFIVYDSSEFYVETHKRINFVNIKSNLLIKSEKKFINGADFISCANEERSKLMKTYYDLPKAPEVFENIFKLNINDSEMKSNDFIKFKDCKKFKFVYPSGLNNFDFLFEMSSISKDLEEEMILIICGYSSKKNKEKLNKFLELKKINNVKYIGMLSHNQYGEILKNSQVIISKYPMDTLNNINCASGKIYEAIFMDLPILASINPPMKRIIEQNNIGVSTENFKHGAIRLINEYDYFKKNVMEFKEKINLDSIKSNFSQEFKKYYLQKENKN